MPFVYFEKLLAPYRAGPLRLLIAYLDPPIIHQRHLHPSLLVSPAIVSLPLRSKPFFETPNRQLLPLHYNVSAPQ